MKALPPPPRRAPGFTLIELLVVLAIVATLLTIALPRYFNSLDSSKETVLIENLRVTRDAIDRFYSDKGRYPEGLDELVSSRYLRGKPVDPIAESDSAWKLIPPPGDLKGKVYDIRSSAAGQAKDGRTYGDL